VKARRSPAIPVSSRAAGVAHPSSKGRALGAQGDHPPEAMGMLPVRSRQGASVPALRPAWASWIPGTAPRPAMKRVMRSRGSICPSSHRPRSWGLMRPSGSTAEASVSTSPAPPWARPPRWTRCQSEGRPAVAEYWHMGETAMRLGKVVPRRVSGSKSPGMVRLPGARISFTLRMPCPPP